MVGRSDPEKGCVPIMGHHNVRLHARCRRTKLWWQRNETFLNLDDRILSHVNTLSSIPTTDDVTEKTIQNLYMHILLLSSCLSVRPSVCCLSVPYQSYTPHDTIQNSCRAIIYPFPPSHKVP